MNSTDDFHNPLLDDEDEDDYSPSQASTSEVQEQPAAPAPAAPPKKKFRITESPEWETTVDRTQQEMQKAARIKAAQEAEQRGAALPTLPPAVSPKAEPNASKPSEAASKQAKSPKRRKRNGKTYNRKLLNKHDDALLLFLAKARMANTRQLSVATGNTERQVQQRLKGLQEMGLTDNVLMVGTRAVWVVTARGITKLHKRGVLQPHNRLAGINASKINRTGNPHKLAIAMVMAQLVAGRNPIKTGLTNQPYPVECLFHESEIAAAWNLMTQNSKKERYFAKQYDAEQEFKKYRASVQRDPDFPDPEGIFRLYEVRKNPSDKGQDPAKKPDIVVVHPDGIEGGAFAIEVELNAKKLEQYVEILKTYTCSKAVNGVIYVTTDPAVHRLIAEASEVVDKANLPDRTMFARKAVKVVDLKDHTGAVFSGDPYRL